MKRSEKQIEMTVRRAVAFIELFEEWDEKFKSSGWQGKQDWRDILTAHPAAFRKIYGDDHTKLQPQMEIDELWNRYKAGTLYREVLDLADNIAYDKMSQKKRQELERGLNRIRKKVS